MRPTNDALRAALRMNVGFGGMRIGRELLTQQQVNTYLLARIVDLEHAHSKQCAALQTLGLDECEECEEWRPAAEVISAGDRCQCKNCFYWEYFISEQDDTETIDKILPVLMRRLVGTPLLKLLPHDATGKLEEPFLSEYLKITGVPITTVPRLPGDEF
jgi:hypothetical protein